MGAAVCRTVGSELCRGKGSNGADACGGELEVHQCKEDLLSSDASQKLLFPHALEQRTQLPLDPSAVPATSSSSSATLPQSEAREAPVEVRSAVPSKEAAEDIRQPADGANVAEDSVLAASASSPPLQCDAAADKLGQVPCKGESRHLESGIVNASDAEVIVNASDDEVLPSQGDCSGVSLQGSSAASKSPAAAKSHAVAKSSAAAKTKRPLQKRLVSDQRSKLQNGVGEVMGDHSNQAQAGAPNISSSSSSRPKNNKEIRSQPRPKKKKVGCPSTNEDFEQELKAMQKRIKNGESAISKAPVDIMAASGLYSSAASAGDRDVRRNMLISFYKEQYARIESLDVSQYGEENQGLGLTIKNGHMPMPRPKTIVDLPLDYKKPVGNLTSPQLRKFNYESQRMLICVHGDLFDVSDRPDKYSSAGPYWPMVGHDITWGLVCGNDDFTNYDMYFDLFKISPPDMADRKLQGLMSWWCFYHKEYGDPVGRLEVYNKEWELPEPPETGEVCSIM